MPRSYSEQLLPEDWYTPMLKLCIGMVDQMHGRSINDSNRHLSEAHALAKKMILHLISVHRLWESAPSKQYSNYEIGAIRTPIDHSSASVLLRAAFESYLTFSYLYLSPNTELLKLRQKSWKIGALSYRQSIEPFESLDMEKKDRESMLIDELRRDLSSSNCFMALKRKQRDKLYYGTWNVDLSWTSIAKTAGFDGVWFQKIYRYLCAYAHSSYLTVLQINTASNLDEQRRLASFILRISLPLMSKFILQYPRLFPDSMSICHNNPFAFRAAQLHDYVPSDQYFSA